jgi:hypothetical protein
MKFIMRKSEEILARAFCRVALVRHQRLLLEPQVHLDSQQNQVSSDARL